MFYNKSLATCPACSCSIFVEEPACPHCGASLGKAEGKSFPRAAASLAMGLALAAIPLSACGDDTSGSGGGGGADGSGGAGQTTSQSATSSNASTSDATSSTDAATSSVASAYGVGPTGSGGDDASSSIAAAYGMGANAGF